MIVFRSWKLAKKVANFFLEYLEVTGDELTDE